MCAAGWVVRWDVPTVFTTVAGANKSAIANALRDASCAAGLRISVFTGVVCARPLWQPTRTVFA